jgi:putative ABC transport system permease protein
MKWTHGIRARLHLLQRNTAEERMDEEMRFHLEMETEKNLREGMSPEEARRHAMLAFGGVERHREAMRDGRTLAWADGLALDLKLGLRMLAKYPGLAVVGVLGMAVGITYGASLFTFIAVANDPALPLDEGHRVVAIQNLDAARSDQARETHLHDLVTWREELRALEEVAAYRTVDRNLVTRDGRGEPLRIAEMTASGFRVARVPPLLGRYLVDEDERPGAPPVVVIGYEVWQSRFAGQPDVVGQTIRFGNVAHTVVGVMPEGFAFPVNNRLWAPLRLNPLDFDRGAAPPIEVFGRLAPGVALEQAQAQLTTIGRRIAAEHPETHRHVRPEVLPYTLSFLDAPELRWVFYLVQLLAGFLLVVVAVNVAILVYARTVTRAGEIAVRLALGASRARVVAQLFAEALVLSLAAAALGLVTTWLWLRQGNAYMERMAGEQVPFWWKLNLSAGTVAYVAGLTLLAAVIVGVAPGLKATGRTMESTLRQLGGGTGMRMGRTWTVLIVAQVAVAVAVIPPTIALGWKEFFPAGVAAPDFDAEGLLTGGLRMDRETPPSAEAQRYEREFAARLASRQSALVSRLEAEPGVAGATYMSAVSPGFIEIHDTGSGAEPARHGTRFVGVDPGLFEVFGATFLAGRPFHAGDLAGPATAVVANRSFVEQVLGGGSALGRRFRYVDGDALPGGVEKGAWYEIVGVVSDFPVELPYRWQGVGTLYHPAAPGHLNPATLVVRTRGIDSGSFAGRLREIATALDPTLQLGEVHTVAYLQRQEERTRRLLTLGIAVAVLSVILLSAAGIHALVSFTVTRRRKEIGIRTALGAQPRRILGSVLSGTVGQLALGAGIGGLLGGAVIAAGGHPPARAVALLAATAALMLGVGVLAAMGPARRGLRIQPMDALRED